MISVRSLTFIGAFVASLLLLLASASLYGYAEHHKLWFESTTFGTNIIFSIMSAVFGVSVIFSLASDYD